MTRRRFEAERQRSGLPPSPKKCPLCGQEMDLSLDGFVIYDAVPGPYSKVGVRFKCSGDDCNFLESKRINTSEKAFVVGFWRLALALHRLMGPDTGARRVVRSMRGRR